MKHLARILILTIPLILIVLSACGGGAPTSTASSPNQAYTQIWKTVAAGQTQTAGAASPTPQASETPKASVTPKVTNTPLISPTGSAGATAATTDVPGSTKAPTATKTTARSGSGDVCDNFQFVSDVTYPDGSEVPAGTTIIKTWRIKNLGPCEWNEDYEITYGWGGEGTNWNTSSPVRFGKTVKVGESIELSMELDTPEEAGDYGAVFRVCNDDAVYFGPTLTIYVVVK